MQKPLLLSKDPIAFLQLMPISTRLTVGSMVCLTEGVLATVMFMAPKNIWFYGNNVLLMVAIWAMLHQFRFTKLGAEVSELSFYDAAVASVMLCLALIGIMPTIGWYVSGAISILKLLRVYAWQGSVTQEKGWGVFGPITYYFNKHHPADNEAGSRAKMGVAFALAILAAALGSVLIKQLPEVWRVVLAWVVPLSFELIYGPRQLRALASFIPAFLTSTQRLPMPRLRSSSRPTTS